MARPRRPLNHRPKCALQILAGLLRPTAARALIGEHDVGTADGRVEVERMLGYLPQDLGVYPDRTATEFLDYVALLKSIDDRATRHRRVAELLEMVALSTVAKKRLKGFSGEGFSHPGCRFDVVGAIGPTVHKYHQDNPELHEVTRAVFPAYRCEFAGDETEEETRYRYTRAAGVPVTRLDREPHPYLKMRHRAESGRVIPNRGFAQPKTLVHELRTLEDRPDRFVEFENYRHEVWRVEWAGGWVLTGESAEHRRLGFDELRKFARDSLYGPNLDAIKTPFP